MAAHGVTSLIRASPTRGLGDIIQRASVGSRAISARTPKGAVVTQALLQAVEEIRPVIEEHAQAAEANRQLADEVYDAMYRAGLYAMLAPKAYGGLEVHPVEAMQVWEAVARIDSAAAWNLVMNQAIDQVTISIRRCTGWPKASFRRQAPWT